LENLKTNNVKTFSKTEIIKYFFVNHKVSTIKGISESTGIPIETVKRICNKLLKEGIIKNGTFTLEKDGFTFPDQHCYRLVKEKRFTQQLLNLGTEDSEQ
jgi:predicted transcriptional regulator